MRAELSPKQIKTIQLSRRKGEELAEHHPEITKLYAPEEIVENPETGDRNWWTEKEIAEVYLGRKYKPEIGRIIVSHALRLIAGESELGKLEEISERHKSFFGELAREMETGVFDPNNRKRVEEGRIKAVEARGDSLYTDEELGRISELKKRGYTWKEIANKVNAEFGNGRTHGAMRTAYSKRFGK